jgi:hypothetical protein
MGATGDVVQGRCGQHRECGARWGFPRPHAALLLLAMFCAPPAFAAAAVDIAAAIGFTDTFQPGRWAPLNVTVTNRGGDFIGELDVQVVGGDALRGRQFVSSHRRKLELHRDSRKTLQFTVRPQGFAHPLVIRAHAGGREVARMEVDLSARYSAERLLLVLSRSASLEYLDDDGADGLRVLRPHPELLPVHWRGYDAVAAIVVHGVSLESLNEGQFDALHKWIAQGGILAVSGGADYALLRTPRLAALLPGLPLGMARVDAGALRSAFSASLDVSRPVYVNSLGNFRGRARLRAGDTVLAVERALGLGRVLYLTFDVGSHPFDRWDGMRELWLTSLRLPPPGPLTAAGSTLDSPLPSLVRGASTNFPAHATVLSFLALYLGLLLAGYLLPARGGGRSWHASLWTWAVPLIFAPAAWLLFGPPAFSRGATALAVAVIEPFPDSGYARLGLDLGVYAHRSGPLRLEYRGSEPVLYPPRRAQREGTAENWVFGEGARPFVEPLDRRRYVLHALEGEDVIAFHLDASLHDEAPGPRLVLDNASGRALEDPWLIFDGYAYELGPIPAGARFERRLARRAQGVEVDEASWHRVLRPPGDRTQAPAPAWIALQRQSRATGASGYPGQGQALLVAYTASPLQPSGVSAGWPRHERALVALRVAAIAGGASAGEPANGRLDAGDGDPERHESPPPRAAAADAKKDD